MPLSCVTEPTARRSTQTGRVVTVYSRRRAGRLPRGPVLLSCVTEPTARRSTQTGRVVTVLQAPLQPRRVTAVSGDARRNNANAPGGDGGKGGARAALGRHVALLACGYTSAVSSFLFQIAGILCGVMCYAPTTEY